MLAGLLEQNHCQQVGPSEAPLNIRQKLSFPENAGWTDCGDASVVASLDNMSIQVYMRPG